MAIRTYRSGPKARNLVMPVSGVGEIIENLQYAKFRFRCFIRYVANENSGPSVGLWQLGLDGFFSITAVVVAEGITGFYDRIGVTFMHTYPIFAQASVGIRVALPRIRFPIGVCADALVHGFLFKPHLLTLPSLLAQSPVDGNGSLSNLLSVHILQCLFRISF